MTEKLTEYDVAADLVNEEAMAIFLAAAFETNDAGYVAHAFDVAVRAQKIHHGPSGIKVIEGPLVKQLRAEGVDLTLKTALAVASRLGIKLTVKPRDVGG
jgi:probable addiction module antidote protein